MRESCTSPNTFPFAPSLFSCVCPPPTACSHTEAYAGGFTLEVEYTASGSAEKSALTVAVAPAAVAAEPDGAAAFHALRLRCIDTV